MARQVTWRPTLPRPTARLDGSFRRALSVAEAVTGDVNRGTVQTEEILNSIEETIENQLALNDGGEGLEEAALALLAVLRPAIKQAAFTIAEQAAVEVGAQLDGYSVTVVLDDGEPSLLVREDAAGRSFTADDLSARITLRLPDSLKDDIEAAAGAAGDSVNAFVVKALSKRSSRRSSRRITESFET